MCLFRQGRMPYSSTIKRRNNNNFHLSFVLFLNIRCRSFRLHPEKLWSSSSRLKTRFACRNSLRRLLFSGLRSVVVEHVSVKVCITQKLVRFAKKKAQSQPLIIFTDYNHTIIFHCEKRGYHLADICLM